MTEHRCHVTPADAHRHVTALNARAQHARRRYTVARCRCGDGWIASHDPVMVRARRAAGRRRKQVGKRAQRYGGAA